jgi:ribosome-binding protein aMBF1 (putative translation factor)
MSRPVRTKASEPQAITTESGEELIVLTRRAYDALLARAGDEAAEDRMTRILVRAARGQSEKPMPAWLAESVARGVSPIKAARIHGGLTQMQLAERAGIGQAYLSEIESGKKRGTDEILDKIAAELGVETDWLREE